LDSDCFRTGGGGSFLPQAEAKKTNKMERRSSGKKRILRFIWLSRIVRLNRIIIAEAFKSDNIQKGPKEKFRDPTVAPPDAPQLPGIP